MVAAERSVSYRTGTIVLEATDANKEEQRPQATTPGLRLELPPIQFQSLRQVALIQHNYPVCTDFKEKKGKF